VPKIGVEYPKVLQQGCARGLFGFALCVGFGAVALADLLRGSVMDNVGTIRLVSIVVLLVTVFLVCRLLWRLGSRR
jgi:hypothetical protein